MDYEIEQVPEGTYAVIRRTVAFSDVPKVMPELMGKVQQLGGLGTTRVAHVHLVDHPRRAAEHRTRRRGRAGRSRAARRLRPGDATRAARGGASLRRPVRSAAGRLPGVFDRLQRDGHTENGEPIEIYENHDPVPETRIIWPIG